MPTQRPEDVRADVENILKVWTTNPDFKLKDVTLQSFQGAADKFLVVLAEINRHEEGLKPLRNQRDDQADVLNGLCTRARAGIKGYFGENSSEYEAAGGTRASERKKTGRKSAPSTKSQP